MDRAIAAIPDPYRDALREVAEEKFGLEDIFLAATRRAPGEGRRS